MSCREGRAGGETQAGREGGKERAASYREGQAAQEEKGGSFHEVSASSGEQGSYKLDKMQKTAA